MYKSILITLFLLLLLGSCSSSREQAMRTAVERQMSQYPASTLQDLYKSFFQDNFGPGHMVRDTAAAGRYLDSELAASRNRQEAPYEPTGYKARYYRVSLSIIQEGSMTRDAFFAAFLRSVAQLHPLTPHEWRKEWGRIDRVIKRMNLHLQDEGRDRARIDSLLQQPGDFALHHSEAYNSAYNRHYRIIAHDIFIKEILPYITTPHHTPAP